MFGKDLPDYGGHYHFQIRININPAFPILNAWLRNQASQFFVSANGDFGYTFLPTTDKEKSSQNPCESAYRICPRSCLAPHCLALRSKAWGQHLFEHGIGEVKPLLEHHALDHHYQRIVGSPAFCTHLIILSA
jgi:hypothetical protein